tara:strand:- start:658 stop:858 length:201 start_codon:yes stop_codon:yes gene_type:complete
LSDGSYQKQSRVLTFKRHESEKVIDQAQAIHSQNRDFKSFRNTIRALYQLIFTVEKALREEATYDY